MKRVLMAVLMMLGALLGTTAMALADGPGEAKEKGAGKGKNKMAGMAYQWKATSPAIHEGDSYTLRMTNTSEEDQKARVRTVIMDHRNHTNTDVIDEQVELAPGEEREFTAVNDYGAANHFNTIIGSNTKDLALAVRVDDFEGRETARFNEGAFLVQEGKAGGGAKAKGHSHDEGFAASVPATLWDTARLSPLSLGVLGIAGFGLHAARRRRTLAVPGSSQLTGPVALPRVWKVLAVGGLILSAALHIGLAPVHFGEAVVQGIFFFVVGGISAIIAAAILAWPSQLAYLAGVGISLALILLWLVFLVVPPPGSETAEAVDLVGLFTKASEVVAATACAILWFRDRRTVRLDQVES